MANLLMLLLAPLFALYRGWALWVLWGWFAPVSWGPMPWINAVGVSFIVGFLVTQDTKTDRTSGERVGLAIVYPLVVLLVGLIVHACGVHGI
jgi:hypothetical protein